ncbi:hypothetical protein DCS_02054 [Drechmeria coniospora]|uniref:Uncharacterized protein n=1 Tax=Drechmeria coniospora TaxID=98403 RepID=A0A151GUX3_DRECN|nr:hypothetical protein DCS_02054 [Drechmeria coniospora]KYK60914.1 hypothetical protein DCS_02054 [Drechmeria coniospora]
MEEESLRYCCIDKPRCGLCQFLLRDGEAVVARLFDLGNDVPETMLMLGLSDTQSSTTSTHPLRSRFDEMTQYDFNPSMCWEETRRRRIRSKVASELSAAGLLRRMPRELCCMVARYLVRECAAVDWEHRTRDRRPSTYTIQLDQDIYMTRTAVEGVSYVQSLHNRSAPSRRSGRLVHDSRAGHVDWKIYVAYDHLGVRDVDVWSASDEDLPTSRIRHGVWWTELAPDAAGSARGLKVRRLENDAHVPSTTKGSFPSPRWPIPGLACRVLDLDTCAVAESPPGSLRMSFFECNASLTTGYSVAISGNHIRTICSHHSGTPPRCYSEMDAISTSSLLWMHLPMSTDEHLAEIWALKHLESGFVALMLCTSRKRAVLFGSYMLHPEVPLQLCRVYATANRPSRVYFDDWDPFWDAKRIKHLAFVGDGLDARGTQTADRISSWKPYPPSLMAASPPPYTQYNEPWYYTNCRLENATEITCCADETASHKPIIGILVRYRDGSRSCLGQHRTDREQHTSTVHPATPLRIGLGKTKRKLPFVKKISTQDPSRPEVGSLSWISIPWRGRLEWWFSQRQCKICHSE